MGKYLLYAAYGWLTLTGVLHFAVDVVSQLLRGKRAPGLATTLYYGLNSAFSLGQVAYGLLGLLIATRAMSLFHELPVQMLSIAVGFGWLATTLMFMEYREPKFNAAVFCILVIAAAVID